MASSKMRAAWWWIDRWKSSDAYEEMTLAEQGAFRNLLDALWSRGGALPNDDRMLGKLCGDQLEWERVRERVMQEFYLAEDGWRNEVHDEIQAESEKRAERQQRYRDKKKREQQAKEGRNGERNVTRHGDGRDDANVAPSPDPSPSQSLEKSPAAEARARASEPPGPIAELDALLSGGDPPDPPAAAQERAGDDPETYPARGYAPLWADLSFQAAWRDWVGYRRERDRNRDPAPRTMRHDLDLVVAHGVPWFVEESKHQIGVGRFAKLYPPGSRRGPTSTSEPDDIIARLNRRREREARSVAS